MGRRRGRRGGHPPQRHRAARAVAAPARLGGRPGSRRARQLPDRQRARGVRPAGHRPCLLRRRRLAGAVRLRPHRAAGLRGRRAVPRHLAVGGRRAAGDLGRRARRHDVGRARRVAAGGVSRPGRRRPGHPGACTPRSVACRGAPRTAPRRRPATPGLAFAGAWTATGWPDTMEGAVRSGHAAASAALGARALSPRPTSGRAPDVNPPPPAADILRRTRALARPALRAAVDRLSPRLRPPVEYHLGWTDIDGNPVDGDGGKHVRRRARRAVGIRRRHRRVDRSSRSRRDRVGAQLLADPRRPDGDGAVDEDGQQRAGSGGVLGDVVREAGSPPPRPKWASRRIGASECSAMSTSAGSPCGAAAERAFSAARYRSTSRAAYAALNSVQI